MKILACDRCRIQLCPTETAHVFTLKRIGAVAEQGELCSTCFKIVTDVIYLQHKPPYIKVGL